MPELEIYQPSDDSYLMSETLRKELPQLILKNPKLKFLEIGVGSGINLWTALDSKVKKNNILGTDINPAAVKHCKKVGFNCIKSDLFNKIKGKYDVIVFNPPYLPEDKDEPAGSRVATTGGKLGNEIIMRFLREAKEHLTRGGVIYIITSSLARDIDFKLFGFDSEKRAQKDLFFEKLYLWKLNLR